MGEAVESDPRSATGGDPAESGDACVEPGQAAGPTPFASRAASASTTWVPEEIEGDAQEVRLDPGHALTVARGGGIQLSGITIGAGLSYGFRALAARRLGAHEYGLFVLGLSIVQTISLVSLLGLNRGVVRYVAMYRASGHRSAERGVVILATAIVGISGSTLAGLTLLFAERICSLFPEGMLGLAGVLRTMALGVLGLSIYTLLGGVTAGQKRMGSNVLVTRIIQPLSALLFLAALSAFPRMGGVTLAYVLSTFIAALFGLSFVRDCFRPGLGRAAYPLKPILLFSLPILGAAMLQRTTNRLEIYVLGLSQGPEEIAIFDVAARTVSTSVMALQSLNVMFAPMASDLHSRGQRGQLTELLTLVTRWSLLWSVPALVVTCLFAGEILSLFGSAFVAGALALVILAIGRFVNGATGPVGFAIVMAGHSRLNLLNSGVVLGLNLLLDLWLIPRFGVVGAALGSSISLSVVNLLRLSEVYLVLKLAAYDLRSIKPLLAGLLAGGAVWMLKSAGLLGGGLPCLGAGAGAFALLYLLAILGMGLEREELAVIRSSLARLRGIR